MTKTLKILTATLAALVMAIAIGAGTARAGGVHFDFAIAAPIPFGYATIHSDHYYPRYYGPYYYAPYYYAPYYRPGYLHVHRPYYKRVYRYERHVIRDGRHWRGHDRDRWRDRDHRHDRRWRR